MSAKVLQWPRARQFKGLKEASMDDWIVMQNMGKDEAGGGSVMLKSFIFNLEAMEAIKRLGKRSRE